MAYRQGLGAEFQKYMLQLGYQCAPVIKNVKVSNIIILPSYMRKWVFSTWNHTKISVSILCELEEKTVFFIYRREELWRHLNQKENKMFLKKFGYSIQNVQKEDELSEMMQCLSLRYEKYHKGNGVFPHELGIFLEYPVEDVKGFIKHEGKNSLCAGYWKVYHNIESAQKMFLKYDLAKKEVVSAMMQGRPFQELLIETKQVSLF